jgi:nitroreductase
METKTTSRRAALRFAVAKAILAPSVHNTQPWRFALRGNRLDVIVDPRRRLTVLDPSGRQMYLSTGCALFNARVALAAAGCPVRLTRWPDADQPGLVARLEFDGDQPIDPALAALGPAVERRQTNRRRFEGEPVPPDVVEAWTRAAAVEGAVLHPVLRAEDRQALARLSQRADAEQITDPAYRAELRAWTSADAQRLDGVPARVVAHVDGTSGDEIPLRDFDSQGAGWLPADTHSSAQHCLLVLGTTGDDPAAWVRAGEALERVWLEITSAGYVASVFTQIIESPSLRVALSHELRLGLRPHIVLRVGRAPLTPASPRRHLADVLDEDEPQW